ncbi:MAG TPA: outer membrane protein assembly factor BamA, partial [Candidatus Polarisedimenticolia bacterium]|nr:outer membrane protein assembly factor BamA [Candidatus Polarisedimenticolia bacterium]
LMNVDGTGRLRGTQIAALNLSLKGTDVQLAYPEGFRGRYDMDLALIQDEAGRRLGGAVDLVRGVYSKDFDIERSLFSLSHEDELAAEAEAMEEEGALSPMKLDVTLRAERGLWIVNDLGKLEGWGVLQIGGTVGLPQITGRISAFEGGILRFRQVEYRVDRGNIDLVDLDRFNPYFDIAGETRVQDYDIFLKIEGSLEHLEYELTSNPPLSQQDILALLVAGRTLENVASAAGGQQVLGESAARALTGSLALGLGEKLQSATRLDQFTIDPVILGREGDPASRITVGKQISENLFAAYSSLLGGSSEEIYQLDYKIGRDFKLTSTRDSDGGLAGDVRYGWRLKTGPAAAIPSAPPRWIRNIVVEGDPGISPEKLRRLFGMKEGDKMDRGRATAGEEKLVDYYHRKSQLEAVVEASEVEAQGESNLSDLRLRVKPGPKVVVRVEGTKSDRKYRRRIRELWKESVFPDETPEETKDKLEHLLHREGYYKAKVGFTLPSDTPQLREAVFRAELGPRIHVESIEMTGNQVIPTSELLRIIHSRRGKHSYLNPDEARSDASRIRGQYLFVGYPEARVALPEIALLPDGSSATLRFEITEGDPMRIASVRVIGNSSLETGRLLEAIPLKTGHPILRSRLRNGADLIRSLYDREGYRGTKVTYELVGPKKADLVYRVEEGPRRVVGDIQVEGNLLTRREVVERELTFKAGDPLSRDELLKSQRALYRLGVFQTVEFLEKDGVDVDHPVIRIRVSEANNLLQSVGVGYDSQEGIRGIYNITNTNVMGRGRTISLTLRGSNIDSRAQVLLKDPFLFNRRLDSLLAAYWEHQERESFTQETLGTTLQVSKKHTKADRTFYRYTLKDVDILDLKVPESEAGAQSLRLSGPSFSIIHDTRDDFFNPRKGVFGSLDLGVVSTALGSDVNFERIYLTGSLFRTVAPGTVWAQSARAGFLVPGRRTPEIPISERFFAGGDTTVRGFGRDQMGPKEIDPVTGEIGDPLGGESIFILNEELRFPIWKFLRGTVFFDAGNVTREVRDFNPLVLRTVLGLGVRIDTPIGPFRLEYGWKLDRERDESPGELNLSIGQAF